MLKSKKLFKKVVGKVDKDKRKINSLENELESLKSIIKDELYKEFMDKIGETKECDRLRKENSRLRSKVKELKEIIKEK